MNGAKSCDSYPFAAFGSDWQPLGASGGVRGRSGAKAKKANGFLRKPNNPRLYDNVSLTNGNVTLTNDNVCRNPQNVSRKRKNVCIYSLYACRFGGNADGIIIGGHYEADSKH